jgi:hypothetical protein
MGTEIISIHQMAPFARGKVTTPSCQSQPASHALSSRPPPTSTMTSTSQPQKGRDVVLPTLDVSIQVLNIAKDACGIPPAQIALGSASTLLTMIRVRFSLLLHKRLTTDSRLFRTRWPTIRIMSTLDEIVGMYVKSSTGD